MNRIQAERCCKLYTFLRHEVPRKRFDITTWFTSENPKYKKLYNECNTVACALGWATYLFPKQLKLEVTTEPSYDCDGIVATYIAYNKGGSPERDFFGLNHDEVNIFTTPGYYNPYYGGLSDDEVTPKIVAQELRKIVKNYYPDLVKKYDAKKRNPTKKIKYKT